jgi:hypothetical protein
VEEDDLVQEVRRAEEAARIAELNFRYGIGIRGGNSILIPRWSRLSSSRQATTLSSSSRISWRVFGASPPTAVAKIRGEA